MKLKKKYWWLDLICDVEGSDISVSYSWYKTVTKKTLKIKKFKDGREEREREREIERERER